MAGLVAYIAALIAFFAIDATWLTLVAVEIFRDVAAPVLRDHPLLEAAALFYLLYPLGMVWLVILPSLRANSSRMAASGGAMLGLTAYGTFDLTALTIIEGWTWGLALLDMAWGTFVTTIGCLVGFEVARRIAPFRTILSS